MRRGFTLIEVMAVVVIIGILSALGYASLRDVIFKSRAKDAAVNTAAFLDRIAMESKRLDQTLCVKVSIPLLYARKCPETGCGDCTAGDLIAEFEIGSGFSPATTISGLATTNNFNVIKYTPNIGLSNLKEEGYIAVCYANSRFCGAAVKVKNQNFVSPYVSSDNCSSWEPI